MKIMNNIVSSKVTLLNDVLHSLEQESLAFLELKTYPSKFTFVDSIQELNSYSDSTFGHEAGIWVSVNAQGLFSYLETNGDPRDKTKLYNLTFLEMFERLIYKYISLTVKTLFDGSKTMEIAMSEFKKGNFQPFNALRSVQNKMESDLKQKLNDFLAIPDITKKIALFK